MILLVVIYIIFVSIGLPDGALGSGWPVIHRSLGVPLSFGGAIALTLTAMTILSSLATSYLMRKIGVWLLLTLSVSLTAVALIGFSLSHSAVWLFVWALPLGFGGGAIDSALNNYVTQRYGAHHMNWLHACWGAGATLGPIVFAASLTATGDWHAGYRTLGLLQFCVVVILIASVSVWTKARRQHAAADAEHGHTKFSYRLLLQDRTILLSVIIFLLYTGVEVAVGLWLASYLVAIQSITAGTAAAWTGLYYGAITIGRLATGFISFKMSPGRMVRLGVLLSLLGMIMLATNSTAGISVLGILLIGLGFAPVYPQLIHVTPTRFGRDKSAKVMSLQMVGGYVGASAIPPLTGLLADMISLRAFVIITITLLGCLLVCDELLRRLITTRDNARAS